MKLYPRIRPWLLGCICLLMCGCDLCDGNDNDGGDGGGGGNVTPPATFHFKITGECKATDESGTDIAQLELVAGQTVEYCNNWSAKAEVKFSLAGFLPGGALALTLQPGECVTH